MAWGYTRSGQRELVAVRPGMRECYEDWLDWGRDLVKRGLPSPWLVMTDGAPVLIRGVRELRPDADRQRCTGHRLRNLLAKLPKRDTTLRERLRGARPGQIETSTVGQHGGVGRAASCRIGDYCKLLCAFGLRDTVARPYHSRDPVFYDYDNGRGQYTKAAEIHPNVSGDTQVERTRTMLLLGAAFVVVGVGLGIVGVVRLTADDPEIDRLNDEIAAVDDDATVVAAEKAEVDAQLLAVVSDQEGQEAMVTAAGNLDQALVDWVEHFEDFVEASQDKVAAWNAALARDTSIEQLAADVDAEVKPALEAVRGARDALLEAFEEAEAALAELEQTLANSGGDR